MDESGTDTQTIRVRAPIEDPEFGSECMSAAPDPESADQAVLLNAPFWVEGLNYGDIVRLGPPDQIGLRPIVEVLVPSGHRHVIALTGGYRTDGLYSRLLESFPEYALRIEGHAETMLCVSVHPDLDPDDVVAAMAGWLDDEGAADDEDVALSPVFETRIGPVRWPTW
jgi:hypothetical protein